MTPATSPRIFLLNAACSGFLAVALGAFGAHALKDQLDSYAMSIFNTAVQYHMIHTLALLAVALLAVRVERPSRLLFSAGIAFTAGILIFSGSLYVLSITGVRWLGAITPIGGLGFLLGWALLFCWALVDKPRQ